MICGSIVINLAIRRCDIGTNYYVYIEPCEKCHVPKEKIHIGKQSWGWSFLFHNHFSSKKEWISFLSEEPHKDNIYNEYEDHVPLEVLLETIEVSKDRGSHYSSKEDEHMAQRLDEEGFRISQFSEFS